jgi:arylsulfatase A-like enzyme
LFFFLYLHLKLIFLKNFILVFVVATVCIVGFTNFLRKPQVGDKYKIFWDEKLIAGKDSFLARGPSLSAIDKQPNIIIILADDLGQKDISLYGNKSIETPYIDALGKNGVTFSEAYISSPVCSPSRAGLLTGRYQQRFGHEFQPLDRYLKNMVEYYALKMMPKFKPLSPIKMTEVPAVEDRLRQGLPPSEITLADVLKKEGYATGIIGKWHLGAAEFAKPCARGFDYSYGFYEAFTLYAPKKEKNIVNRPLRSQFMDMHQWKTAEGRTGNCAILRNCCERQEEDKYLTDALTDEAIAFVDRNEKKPFFLYLPYNAPHVPLQAQQKYYDQFSHIEDKTKRVYAAMIKNLDDEVGRLTAHLEQKGLLENTLIFFLSDNGGAAYNGTTDNAPYKGGKLTNFEGGIRVPFMMQWKGKISPGQTYTHPVISLDIFKTVCDVLGITLPSDRVYDGVNLMNKISKNEVAHDALFWRSEYNKAIRKDKWKLLINEADSQIRLYDLSKDISEKNNLVDSYKTKVDSMALEIEQWEMNMIKPLWPRIVNYVYRDGKEKTRFGF